MKKINFNQGCGGHTRLEGANKLQWGLCGPLHRLAGALDTMARQHPDIAKELKSAQIALLEEARDIHYQYLIYKDKVMTEREAFSEEAKKLVKDSGRRLIGVNIKDPKKQKKQEQGESE